MKKSIVLGLTATLLTFGPLVAGPKAAAKSSKPAVQSQATQTQKQQPGTTTQSTTSSQTTTTTKSNHKMSSNRIHKLTGTVDNISSSELTVTTKSGNKDNFAIESTTKDVNQPKVGDRVTVWYRESNGQKMATRIVDRSAKSTSNRTSSSNRTKSQPSQPGMTTHH